ncbi:kelch-like protein 12 [Biomphalaria glabrata]|uniref:Uncharacterized protein LOC106051667 isoform X1 n=1 Tax=Biomphalaria glabrata TaxID=6526 RepID=A0A2C9L3D2_BIOGL|nr:uncharacterized protein LOC106051667 isoform X1 [Biomphalaria glabrata]KAI8735379.1 hypothetical protein BgiMline_027649 [Biomphalaria glabrata]KAI8784660.1 hypothetical protein BgiBS90_014187 [Biomphalaria glabrata]
MSHYVKATKKTFSKNAHDCIVRPLLKQRETGELCDIVLKLNDRCYNAHRAILALWSPYFHSMFTCDMKEKNIKEIDLSASLILEQDTVFSTVLDYMYTGSLPLTTETITDVVKISDFLLLDDVREFCQQFLLGLGNLDLSNCLRVRFLAEDHNLPEVAAAAKCIIESRFHDYLIHHEDILELPWVWLVKLLEDPCVIQHTGYKELRKLASKWINHDKVARVPYLQQLNCAISAWVSDYTNEASYLGRELRRSLEGRDAIGQKQNSPIDDINNPSLDNSMYTSLELPSNADTLLLENTEDVIQGNVGSSLTSQILFTVVCNQGLKFLKLFLYSLEDQLWFHFSVSGERLLKFVPMRQTVCNMLAHEGKVYMYLCSSFPYPTDMLKINILTIDLFTGQPALFSFRTVDYYKPTYRTTLTNYRTAPPAMVMCSGQLFVVGNKEGTGHLFACNLANNQYTCYQIPSSRFISLARCVVRNNRQIFIWYRHRTGPSEEFSIKKSVGFVLFDAKMKIFSSWELTPPDISYDDFAKCYTMCVRDDTVYIYQPGEPAVILDEVRVKWITSLRRIPLPSPEYIREPQAYGYQIAVPTQDGILILNNWQPYTTSLHEISEKVPYPISHIPPPIDNISVATLAELPKYLLRNLQRCKNYDEAYASALHVAMQYSDGDTDDSAGSVLEGADSENEDEYEYDEDIYEYDYDMGNFEV